MKIYYGSDFHSDMWEGKNIQDVIKGEYDLYLLAGDLGEYTCGSSEVKILTLLPEDKTFWTPGNHEYYSGQIEDVEEKAAHHKGYLQNSHVDLPGFRLFGSTFWTNFLDSMDHAEIAYRYMNDFRYIRTFALPKDKALTPYRVLEMNREARAALVHAWETRNPEDKFVVMTHHSPSFRSTPKKYQGPAYMDQVKLNAAYSNNLEDWFLETGVRPDIWIHGHIHDPVDYELDLDGHKMRVISSPYGYPGEFTQYKERSFEI